MASANIILSINGNNQLTDKLYSEDFNIDRKFEYEFSDFTSVDGFITLPVSKINPISKIIMQSDGPLQIKLDDGVNINTNYISGVAYMSLDPNNAVLSGVTIGTDSLVSVNGIISFLRLA